MFTGFIWLRIGYNEISGRTVNLLRTDLLIKFWRTQSAHLGDEEFLPSAHLGYDGIYLPSFAGN
jgi:hypothetical protein